MPEPGMPRTRLRHPSEEDRAMTIMFWRRLMVPLTLYIIAMEMLHPQLAAEFLRDGLHMNFEFNLDLKRSGHRQHQVRPASSGDAIGVLIENNAGGRGGGREELQAKY
jgi:hypothetical protein